MFADREPTIDRNSDAADTALSSGFDLRSSFAMVTVQLAEEANRKNLALEAAICPGTPRYFFGNKSCFEKIMTKLLRHSIDNTQRGVICVQISSKVLDRNGMIQIIVAVTDTSPGTTEASDGPACPGGSERPAAAAAARLPTVRGLCNRLGGDLSIHSAYGWGARYEARLILQCLGPADLH